MHHYIQQIFGQRVSASAQQQRQVFIRLQMYKQSVIKQKELVFNDKKEQSN